MFSKFFKSVLLVSYCSNLGYKHYFDKLQKLQNVFPKTLLETTKNASCFKIIQGSEQP